LYFIRCLLSIPAFKTNGIDFCNHSEIINYPSTHAEAKEGITFAAMRFLFLFLGLYLLWLSFIPCSDSKDCIAPVEVNISAANTHQEHEHSKEACTPFCICSCCAASSIFSPVQKIQAGRLIIPGNPFTLYSVGLSCETLHNIWQPPRLS
jgi:hypothetical protein